MVEISALWLPILLSAVGVFLASSVIHMVVQYHTTDYGEMAGQDEVLEAMRKAGVAPGDYRFPYAGSLKELGDESMVARFEQGPVGMMTVLPSGVPKMGKQLVLWFVYSLLVSLCAAYLAGRTLDGAVDYLAVFRVVGTVAFLAYAGAEPIASIWYGRKWSTTVKQLFDGLIYALVTAGVFGWLWP